MSLMQSCVSGTRTRVSTHEKWNVTKWFTETSWHTVPRLLTSVFVLEEIFTIPFKSHSITLQLCKGDVEVDSNEMTDFFTAWNRYAPCHAQCENPSWNLPVWTSSMYSPARGQNRKQQNHKNTSQAVATSTMIRYSMLTISYLRNDRTSMSTLTWNIVSSLFIITYWITPTLKCIYRYDLIEPLPAPIFSDILHQTETDQLWILSPNVAGYFVLHHKNRCMHADGKRWLWSNCSHNATTTKSRNRPHHRFSIKTTPKDFYTLSVHSQFLK